MQRREFLAASGAAALGMIASRAARGQESGADRMLIELRTYHFASADKQQAFEQFLASVAIPAFNRAGVEPVGVFKLLEKDNPRTRLTTEAADLWVLLPYKSTDSLIHLEDRMAADESYQKAGESIITSPMSDPAYSRYESTLLYSFPDFPQVQVPNRSPDRLLQLRRYESPNRERAIKKQYMFNEGGELAVFKRSGMTGVFFGEALIGPRLPNLIYMLSFENDAAQKKGWSAFGKDPQWKSLSGDPAYKDTVNQPAIMNLLLRPATGSQI